jgi:hypothetical protein
VTQGTKTCTLQDSSLPQHVIMTRHTSLLISSVHTHTHTQSSLQIHQPTAMAMYTFIFTLSTYTHSYTPLQLYSCDYLPITHKYSHRITVVTYSHHAGHSQRTTLVTSPSHTTLPSYTCGYLSIAHIHSYVHTHLYTLSVHP